MISKPHLITTYLEGQSYHANLQLDFFSGDKVKGKTLTEINHYYLDHANRMRDMQEMFAQLIGLRHILESDLDVHLNGPVYSYREYDLEDIVTSIDVFRTKFREIVKVSKDIHAAYTAVKQSLEEVK